MTKQTASSTLSGPATLVAILLGLLFSLSVWFIQPYNNYLLRNSPVADSYLPTLVVALLMLLVLIVNPLLHWLLPSFALRRKQLAIIFGMGLVACSASTVMKSWPYSLAKSNQQIVQNQTLSDLHKEMDLPDSLYLDGIEYGEDAPVSQAMTDKLEEGESLPWGDWAGPTVAWGSLIVFCLVLMVGLTLVVLPQWRDNERLSFPLLNVQQTLIEPSTDGGKLPAVFRNKLFWTAFIVVFLIHLFRGLNFHTNESFPGFPLGWGLWEAFPGMWGRIPWYVKSGNIIFVIVGVTFFVPSRIAFSLWFTMLAYSLYRVIGYEFFAPFHGDQARLDHRNGATIGMALVILWLGRNQWLAVFKAMARPAQNDVDRRNRLAGILFTFGCLGVLGWQLWAGNSLPFALLAVLVVFLTSLVVARLVAETGIPLLGTELLAGSLLSMMPISWISAKILYLTSMIDLMITSSTSRVSAAVTVMHGMAMDKSATPKTHARLAKGFLLLLVAGLLVAGAVNLYLGHHNATAMDGRHALGNPNAIEEMVHMPLTLLDRESWNTANHNRFLNTLFGFVLAVGLQIACLLSPLWPLHPAGLVLVRTEFLMFAWPSILLGWVLKRAILKYGGAKAFRLAKPLFLGLIVGEVFAAILWAAVPAILIGLGGDAAEVGHISVGI